MDSKGKTILIADDEPDILEIISYNLRNEGYETITAKDGNEALQKASVHKPDLIILDIMLPDGNGVDICTEIKSNEATRHIPVLLMSANINNALKFNESAAEGFISKPFNIDDLLEKVQHIVA